MGGAARKRCPICEAPAVARFAPFCSAHCADEDLGRWLRGDYRIPGAAAGAEAEGENDPDGEPPPRTH